MHRCLHLLGLETGGSCTSLISGFMAKESVVSTLDSIVWRKYRYSALLPTLAAASLLVFSLLYTPCVAAIASVKRELGGKWAAGVVIWQCVVASGGSADRTSDRSAGRNGNIGVKEK